MIKEMLEKIKPFYLLVLILVLGSIFFAFGRLSALEERRTPIRISYPNATSTASIIQATLPRQALVGFPMSDIGQNFVSQAGEVIGSKTGKKYYFPWCGTVNRIKPENQIHFASVEEARAAGYVPAANCKGLK